MAIQNEFTPDKVSWSHQQFKGQTLSWKWNTHLHLEADGEQLTKLIQIHLRTISQGFFLPPSSRCISSLILFQQYASQTTILHLTFDTNVF